MGVVLTLLAGVAMLAVPVCIVVKVTLFATRNDGRVGKGGSATSWSDNLYSAAKRATFAWVAVTLFCVVAYGILGFSGAAFLPWSGHFWMLVAVPVLAFAWGLHRPRIYADGVDRERNGMGDVTFVDHVWRKYNKGLLPNDFLAYNCRYANGGGVSFLYDVAAGTLYAQWSSN